MAVSHRDVAGLLRQHGYTEIKKVGEGSFGKALLVRTDDGQKLICKMVDVSKASRKEMADAVQEGKLLAELRHPYIVRYRESFTESGWLCILMDYCEGGDLTAKIKDAKRKRQSLSEDQILRWFVQAVLALKYTHEKHILHRDLKPGNFFLARGNMLKMGDFGIAKELACTIAVAKTQIGTPYYLSPELCQEKPYSFSSDIWAMGVILYELCALRVPFDAPNIPGLVQKIIRAPIPSLPSTYSPFIRDLLAEMLERNPDRRPSPEEILAKPRLQEIVKQMLDEAQDSADGPGGAEAPAASERRPAPDISVAGDSLEGAYAPRAGSYRIHDQIEYHSPSHGDWLPATVTNVDSEGRIIIDLKPNTWISKEDQATRVRPKAVQSASDRPGSLAGSPPSARRPSQGGLPPRGLAGAAGFAAAHHSPARGYAGLGLPGSRPGSGLASRGGTPLQKRSSPQAAGAMIAGGGSRPSSNAGAAIGGGSRPSSNSGAGSQYQKNDLVEYWSVSHGEWLPATIIDTDHLGQVIIDLKPNTWIPREDQASKLRRRGSGGSAPRQMYRTPSSERLGPRAASPMRGGVPPSPGRQLLGSAPRAASPASWQQGLRNAESPSPLRRFAADGGMRRPPGIPLAGR
eukprot:TRINITY_DN24166_c0_g1_i1.p1 TRINITY_DN24166_c0_g1~~TRINITY_DN24166_c0_g1_i1.p1  ORF type:complete len:630 (+),score=92.83 TRINITY_DN24166_c0_g1_i1:161-2050(+)